MPEPPPPVAYITGSSSGIGRATAELLWARGYSLVLLDLESTQPALLSLQSALTSAANPARRQVCRLVLGDVRDDAAQHRAVQEAVAIGGGARGLAVAVLNAGVGSSRDWLSANPLENDDTRRVVDIDLTAALTGIKLAAQAMMMGSGSGGSIVCIASAAGWFPTPAAPVYAAAKAGLAHACRSLAPRLAQKGVRLTAVCPQYIDTPLVHALVARGEEVARAMMGPLFGKPLLTPQRAAEVIVEAAGAMGGAGAGDGGSSSNSGVLLLLQDGRVVDPFRRRGGGEAAAAQRQQQQRPALSSPPPPLLRFSPAACRAFAARSLRDAASSNPTYKKIVVRRLDTDFRRATEIVAAPLPLLLKPGEVLVRRTFGGINASDVNWTSGRYHGSRRAAEAALPYDAGFESVGVVVAVGQQEEKGGGGAGGEAAAAAATPPPLAPGDAVATMESGFAEWAVVPARRCLRVPSPTPEAVALLTSGLTASLALERVAGVALPAGWGFPGVPRSAAAGDDDDDASGRRRRPRVKVAIVTAAAGGTGQFAVQLLRASGWRVVATCSGGVEGAKARLLRSLGADAVVDYKAAAADGAEGGGGLRGALRRACAEVRAKAKAEEEQAARAGRAGAAGSGAAGGAGAGGAAPPPPGQAGADLVYESVGGGTFDACVDCLADRGCLVVIGMMDQYSTGWSPRSIKGLPEKLLWKSASVRGFFLLRYAPQWGSHLRALSTMAASGALQVAVDGGGDGEGQARFVGIERVADAVDRLQGGRSSGKVVVQLSRELPEQEEERLQARL